MRLESFRDEVAPDTARRVGGSIALTSSQLLVQAVEDGGRRDLDARSLGDHESGTPRYSTTTVAPVRRLDHDCWVADAEGVFSRAVLLLGGRERARTLLAPGP